MTALQRSPVPAQERARFDQRRLFEISGCPQEPQCARSNPPGLTCHLITTAHQRRLLWITAVQVHEARVDISAWRFVSHPAMALHRSSLPTWQCVRHERREEIPHRAPGRRSSHPRRRARTLRGSPTGRPVAPQRSNENPRQYSPGMLNAPWMPEPAVARAPGDRL